MTSLPSRDLRNHTGAVLRQVAAGDTVTITVHGEPVAEIRPLPIARRQFIPRTEIARIITEKQADAGLRSQLARMAGDTTDDLDPTS